MSKQFKPTKIKHTLVESELQGVQMLEKIVKKTQKSNQNIDKQEFRVRKRRRLVFDSNLLLVVKLCLSWIHQRIMVILITG